MFGLSSTLRLRPEGSKRAAAGGARRRRAPRGRILYDRFELDISPGQIVAVIGPSGAGKSVLLRAAASQCPHVIWLKDSAFTRTDKAVVSAVGAGSLPERLAILSRCGLAEADVLLTPARLLSGGQRHRLALAAALHKCRRGCVPRLVIADEFASTLDGATAEMLCRRIRKLIRPGAPATLLLATPREELLDPLEPDKVIIKPIDSPPVVHGAEQSSSLTPGSWPIEQGTIADYDALGRFHYMAGRPAAHKRVYVVRAPAGASARGEPDRAAVLVISPPLTNCRGRNAALPGRYTRLRRRDSLARLNAEMEWISRVVVHPMYRACGLAVRLVRHAIATTPAPMVEALAVMGAVNPFFERAGMTCYGPFEGKLPYWYYLGHHAGLPATEGQIET